jgi:branched-chain amino acid aminotransferase
MINFNGTIVSEEEFKLNSENRGYKYGDALFETLKVVNGVIFFWEDHYFRLMASMRILRMDIPMNFTMEYLESEILKTIEANNLSKTAVRVRVNVDRGDGGKYLPNKNKVLAFNIIVEKHNDPFYSFNTDSPYVVDLYKDYFVAPGLLSGLKSNNKAINVLGSIYAQENDFDNCLLLNTNKQVIEALNGNLFLVKGDKIKTPPLEDGCLKGVMRKQILEIISKDFNLFIEEASISPFELQKADELFITNVIKGVVSITQYRKKTFKNEFAQSLVGKLNAKLRLMS